MSAARKMDNMYYLIIALASRCGLSVKEITGITAPNIKKASTRRRNSQYGKYGEKQSGYKKFLGKE